MPDGTCSCRSATPATGSCCIVLPLVDGLLFGSIGVAFGEGDGAGRLLVTGILLFHLIWQVTLAGSLRPARGGVVAAT